MNPNLFGDWVSGLFRLPARNLADEIAANAELQAQVDRLTAANMELARQLDAVSRERDEAFRAGFEKGWSERLKQERSNIVTTIDDASRLLRYASALSAIAAQETPGANATVKRMARMAREALE